jgi:anti-anti-sigma factor
VNTRSTVAVIRLDGELDIARKQELREALHVAPSARAILLDLEKVTYADSTALAELLRFRAEAQRDGVPVALVATSPQFNRVIAYAGLNEVFSIFEERGAALNHLESVA